MTCVAAISYDGKVYMAADSLGSDGFTGIACKNKKIIRKDMFLIGVTGSFRSMNQIEYDLSLYDIEIHPNDTDDARVYKLCQHICELTGIPKEDKKEEDDDTTDFLIGYNGNIYHLQSDGSMLIPSTSFYAIGAGQYHAEASLYSTDGVLDPLERLKKAIVCANAYILSVNDDMQIEIL